MAELRFEWRKVFGALLAGVLGIALLLGSAHVHPQAAESPLVCAVCHVAADGVALASGADAPLSVEARPRSADPAPAHAPSAEPRQRPTARAPPHSHV